MKFIVSLLAAAAAFGQVASEANAGYRTREGRDQVAAILNDASRDARQRPAELTASLGIREGMTVVDLGTGIGYMLPHLSRAVGAAGTVVAEDIQEDFLERARAKADAERLLNVRFVKGTDRDPKLQPQIADVILVLDAYHHFDYPDRMLAYLAAALRPGGRLAIVEYYKRRGAMPGADPDRALQHIRLDAGDLVKEVEASGFHLVSRREHVPGSQYIAIFERRVP